MTIYYLSCGCVLTDDQVKKYNNKIYCPKCNGRPVRRVGHCKICGKAFEAHLTGAIPLYCKECQALRVKTGANKTGKRKSPENYPKKPAKRKSDCIHYLECLGTRLIRNEKACEGCKDYVNDPLKIDDFISNHRYSNETNHKIDCTLMTLQHN